MSRRAPPNLPEFTLLTLNPAKGYCKTYFHGTRYTDDRDDFAAEVGMDCPEKTRFLGRVPKNESMDFVQTSADSSPPGPRPPIKSMGS